MKALLDSRTFWVALVQAVASVALVVLTELDMVGYVGIVKSMLDISLRLITSEEINRII
jgi:hypothetical protein